MLKPQSNERDYFTIECGFEITLAIFWRLAMLSVNELTANRKPHHSKLLIELH